MDAIQGVKLIEDFFRILTFEFENERWTFVEMNVAAILFGYEYLN